MKRVLATPKLIDWACRRSQLDRDYLEEKFKKLPDWISGELQPTEKQLESFAKFVSVPYGFMFLNNPPEEKIPITDFRTVGSAKIVKPSTDLLKVIYKAQIRQAWYKEFAISEGYSECKLVNSATIETPTVPLAQQIREILRYDLKNNANEISYFKPLRFLIDSIEEQGILVMISGTVGSNTNRTLKTEEFRGFTLCDPVAPLIFVNGRDSNSAQMFTLMHELAHVLLGSTGLSDLGLRMKETNNQSEIWCNQFAAEFLVPAKELREQLIENTKIEEMLTYYSKYFKVSNLVILRRLRDLNVISRSEFNEHWEKELMLQKRKKSESKSGGNFINITLKRVGKKFAYALIASTLEGQTLYRDAFKMLGISKTETLNKLAKKVGVIN